MVSTGIVHPKTEVEFRFARYFDLDVFIFYPVRVDKSFPDPIKCPFPFCFLM